MLDASVGGIGGCPFAPRATGNIATEDLVYLLHGEGIETGIDLDALIGVAEWLEGVLGRQLEGRSIAPARSRRSPAERSRTEWRTGSGWTSAARSPTSSSSGTATRTATRSTG